jgi:hypothetical protein
LGYSEDWLCSIFANLTEDLYVALRAAWLSGMIVHKYRMLQAEQSDLCRIRASMCGNAQSPEVRKTILFLSFANAHRYHIINAD